MDGRAPRQRGLKEALDQLLAQIKDGHQSCVCHGIPEALSVPLSFVVSYASPERPSFPSAVHGCLPARLEIAIHPHF